MVKTVVPSEETLAKYDLVTTKVMRAVWNVMRPALKVILTDYQKSIEQIHNYLFTGILSALKKYMDSTVEPIPQWLSDLNIDIESSMRAEGLYPRDNGQLIQGVFLRVYGTRMDLKHFSDYYQEFTVKFEIKSSQQISVDVVDNCRPQYISYNLNKMRHIVWNDSLEFLRRNQWKYQNFPKQMGQQPQDPFYRDRKPHVDWSTGGAKKPVVVDKRGRLLKASKFPQAQPYKWYSPVDNFLVMQ